MDSKKINELLKELYKIDDSLKSQEKEIKKILVELIKNKPDVKVDENFVSTLKEKINKKTKKEEKSFNPFIIKGFVLAGVAVVVMTFIFAPWQKEGDNIKVFNENYKGLTVNESSEEAFGSLASASFSQDGNTEMGEAEKRSSEVLGLGADEPVSSNDMAVGMPKIAPNPINYNFVYKGDEFELSQEKLPVYKRVEAGNNHSNLSQLIKRLDFGFISLNNFSDMEINNINLVQDKEFGYNIQINLDQNRVNIYNNWRVWPSINKKCNGDQKCVERERITPEDVPEDNKIIEIADNFINKHDIDLSPYGDPVVMKDWERYMDSNRDSVYIPETVSVVYPLIIKEQKVFEESGKEKGLQVSVNIRHMKVASVREISPQAYESSNYEIENNSQKIIDIAEGGGHNNRRYIYDSENSKEVIIFLGTPSLELVNIWKFNREKGQSYELLVPAYIFPIENIEGESNYYYKEYITVPLVKEILNNQNQGGSIESIEPMPLEVKTEVLK